MSELRYNISQLSRLTGTSRTTIHDWLNKGYLIPTQIVGSRRKFTLQAFEQAEKKAMRETQINVRLMTPGKIPGSFFDNLDKLGNKLPEAEENGFTQLIAPTHKDLTNNKLLHRSEQGVSDNKLLQTKNEPSNNKLLQAKESATVQLIEPSHKDIADNKLSQANNIESSLT